MHNGRLLIPYGHKNSVGPNEESNNNAAFFDNRGIVHYEFVRNGQTVNQVYYLEVLEMLREKLYRNDTKLLPTTHRTSITSMRLLTWHCL